MSFEPFFWYSVPRDSLAFFSIPSALMTIVIRKQSIEVPAYRRATYDYPPDDACLRPPRCAFDGAPPRRRRGRGAFSPAGGRPSFSLVFVNAEVKSTLVTGAVVVLAGRDATKRLMSTITYNFSLPFTMFFVSMLVL